ncbi:MAG: hypothetical protein LWW87_08450 [Geobacteraceae bacterium]|nr:hypothetical protein [Geobacteraceae bacterium]
MHQELLRPRLVGRRFDNHSIPLEFLKDFAALEEMIVEVAKLKYKEEHPQRERVPRGFTDGLELHLVAVEEGSAIPIIALVLSTLFPPSNAIYLEKACDAIVETIDSARPDSQQALSLPPHLLGYFDRFGRSLRSDEKIEFTPNGTSPVSLDSSTRRKLIQASRVAEWSEETSLRGGIPEADQVGMSFQVELPDGSRLKAPLFDQHFDSVIEAFNNYRNGMKVELKCIIKRDRQNHMKSVESVEHIRVLDKLDVPTRLEELSALEDGWLNGSGRALDPVGLKQISDLFDTYYDNALPLPYIYPTAEGGIQAEWTFGVWEATLDLNLVSFEAEYQALNVTTGMCNDENFNLNDAACWQQMNEALKLLMREVV